MIEEQRKQGSKNGFEVITNKAHYKIEMNALNVPPVWEIIVTYVSNDPSNFHSTHIVPGNWSRCLVFQFLESLDTGMI